jgi:subtilisin family serine protease
VKKVIVSILILMVLFSTASAHSAKERYIIKLKNDNPQGLETVKKIKSGLYVIHATPEEAKRLKKNPGVEYIEKDFKVNLMVYPVNPYKKPDKPGKPRPSQPAQEVPWGVDRIDADIVWSDYNGSGVKVAVLDTGIDKDHPDLKIAGGVNFVAGKIDRWDDKNGHGTHVAGTIAAQNNDIGVVGVSPGVELYAVKVLGNDGSGWVSDIAEGVYWCIENGMDVISMSFGSSYNSTTLYEALYDAYTNGTILIAAAGNSGDGDPNTDDVTYPARYDFVIAVAATDQADSTPGWSSEGSEIDLAAPGVDILSTYKGGGYTTFSGTSMAAPHVTGTVALYIEKYVQNNNGTKPDFNTVYTALISNADDLMDPGFDNYSGYGLVDADGTVLETGS